PSLIRLSVADHGGVMLVQFREGGAASDPRLDIRTTDTLRWHHQVGKIKLVPIDLENRPAWYKEKVYPANKVDIAYAPFIERFQTFLKEELNKIDAYTHTKQDPQVLLAITKKRLGVKYH
ncbi:hypothetical protein GW17_00002861, partial [Ensete ventricosum]